VALDATLPAVPRPFALARGLTARVALTIVVGCSFALRLVASAAHPAPRYFPDEYLYTALARALGSGQAPNVRGAPASFPALLEPILAAPFHALFSPELAYRLTQAENALLMSLAAVPVYLLARRLTLSTRYALACAVFAVAIPDLVFSSYTLADPVAYPFVMAALAAGVAALDRPSRRGQLLFLALAGLATFARVQYVVLPLAFVAAAAVVDRRRVVRTQRLPLVLIALPLAGAVALGPARVFGYYANVVNLHVGGALLHWAGTDLFLLAFASGIVMVPGALVALARPRGRTETAFAALVTVFAAGVVAEAALYASNGSLRFQERYLFALLPLVPVAFGLYLKHGRPARAAVAAVALGLFALAAHLPLSGYAEALGKIDSPFLVAVFQLEKIVGTANGALLVAVLAAVGAAGAVVVSRRGGGRYAFAGALAVALLASLGSTVNDAANARQVRDAYLPVNPSWVDAMGLRDVTLVQTAGSPPASAVEQLYWNRSIAREALMGAALPTDVYSTPRVRIARDGTIAGVGRTILLQDYAATARFSNARLAARAGTFSLWTADAAPRLSLLEEGRFSDGWLAQSCRLTIWPDLGGRTRGTLRFALSLPANARPATVRFGKARYAIRPGETTVITYTLDARGPWSLAFSTPSGGNARPDLRFTSVRSTAPVFTRAGAPVVRVPYSA
jgi:Dolichyl-phosphate-mannose-protein mannosyltransferase